MRLLLLEAEAQAPDTLSGALRQSGHIVDAFDTPDEGALALRVVEYDLLIFDLGAASARVASLLRDLRAREVQTPALVVASNGSPLERVRILDLGADDYVVKPFALSELEARIRAILRRALAKSGDNILGIGKLRFDLFERGASIGNTRLHLSPREVDILETLILRRGRVVSKAQIRGRLCEWSGDLTDGAIELYIHRLRRKLAGSGARLFTVRGFGYLIQQVRGQG